MPIKVSQLPELYTVDSNTLFSTVDTSGGTLISKKATAIHVANYILQGNAASATKLENSRNINGVAFDGTADITVTAAAGTLSGTTLNSTVVNSSLTSVGTLTSLSTVGDVTVGGNLTVQGTTTTVNNETVSNTETITGTLSVTGTVSGVGFTNYFASPPAIGGTAQSTIKGTVITATDHFVGPVTGNASSATKLATARNINGVAFDGTADIFITTSVPDASTTTKGLVLIPAVGTSGITNSSGTIGLAIATSTQLGGVKIGAGINVAVDGTLTGPVRKFHGFSVDADSNLIYSTTTDTTINLQDEYGADIYEDTDIGTNEYSYSMDADGNLIVTYS